LEPDLSLSLTQNRGEATSFADILCDLWPVESEDALTPEQLRLLRALG
jgi:hypothetical protein